MMISLVLFLKGMIIGLSVAMPVGPSGLMCIQRSLTYGWLSGLFVGLGAATGDAFFSGVAALGLSYVCDYITQYQQFINGFGVLVLTFFGLRIMLASRPIELKEQKSTLLGSYVMSIFLTLTNPMTILYFLSVFPVFGVTQHCNSWYALAALIVGTFVGTTLWFGSLALFISYLRSRLSNTYIAFINKISGIMVLAFAAFLLYKTVCV